MLTDSEKLELAHLQKRLEQITAKESIADFCAALDLGFIPAKHHLLLIEKLEAVERGDIKNLMVFMPPGSAKSSYCSWIFPAWYIGRHPKDNIIQISHIDEHAEEWGRKVKNLLLLQEYKGVFDTRLSQDSRGNGRWATEAGGTYYAAGVGGTITGKRGDLVIIDDPIRTREDADSEGIRNKHWKWYIDDLQTRLKPNAKKIIIQTRWHEDDLSGRIIDRFNKTGLDGFEILSIPMEAEEGDPLGRKPGERLWPEWFTEDMVEIAKGVSRTWWALYQQKPRPDTGGEFKRDWIQFYEPDVSTERSSNIYILVDPASGRSKRKSSKTDLDYTVIWVIGLGMDENIYVLDMIRDRLNLQQRTKALMDFHRRYKPYEVRYEEYGMQADIEHIEYVQSKENYRFPITSVGGKTDKSNRIRNLLPLFERKRVYMPRVLHYTPAEGATVDLIHDFIETEYLPFPLGKHDDMMDSLARLCEPELPLVWPQLHTGNITQFRRRSRGNFRVV